MPIIITIAYNLVICYNYHVFANCEYKFMIKGQDIVVLAALMSAKGTSPYLALADKSQLSVSEAHASIKRLQAASLVNAERHLIKRNVEEFLLHALKYTFPLRMSGGSSVGMPTAYAAPIAEKEFVIVGRAPVWCGSEGEVNGIGIEPIYSSAPLAAKRSREMYDRLALIDMLRGGRVRERQYAERKLKEMIG